MTDVFIGMKCFVSGQLYAVVGFIYILKMVRNIDFSGINIIIGKQRNSDKTILMV